MSFGGLARFGMRGVASARLGHFADLFLQFGDGERLALDLVKANRIDQIPASDEHSKLAHIQFWNQHLLVSGDDFTKVAWEWIEVANMC